MKRHIHTAAVAVMVTAISSAIVFVLCSILFVILAIIATGTPEQAVLNGTSLACICLFIVSAILLWVADTIRHITR